MRITIDNVAKQAKVSRTTVSRVLNKSPLVSEKTRLKVERTIKDLDYKPNLLAKGFRDNKIKTIGVIISNILNPFFTNIVRGIEDMALKYGYSIILCNN